MPHHCCVASLMALPGLHRTLLGKLTALENRPSDLHRSLAGTSATSSEVHQWDRWRGRLLWLLLGIAEDTQASTLGSRQTSERAPSRMRSPVRVAQVS